MKKNPVGRPKTPFDETTHTEIVRLRKALKISKYKCSQLIDVSTTAYSRYENEMDNFIGADKQQELLSLLTKVYNDRLNN